MTFYYVTVEMVVEAEDEEHARDAAMSDDWLELRVIKAEEAEE